MACIGRITTKLRRKSRAQDPATIRAIRAGLATGASARKVWDSLTRHQARKELPAYLEGVVTPQEFFSLFIPSDRTIQNIAHDDPRDDSDAWTLEDAGPTEAGLVLRVLAAVADKSGGRVRHLTKREAHLAAVYLDARPGIKGAPAHQPAWDAYVRARGYLALLNRGEDLADEHLSTADRAAIEQGLEYRPGMIDPTPKEEE
jgi:hypothetical protein